LNQQNISMAITDPFIPVRVLDALLEAGVPFVVLHGESLLGTSKLASDVDLAVGMPVVRALERISLPLRSVGLRAALLWPYDLGGTTSVFFATAGGEEGAQIDFLYDPKGRGRYGLRSLVILADSRPGLRYPVPKLIDQQLYLLRKRTCKSQSERAEKELADLAASTSFEERAERAKRLFSPVAATALVRLMQGVDWPARASANRPVQNALRRALRLLHPVGLWVELIGPERPASEEARALEARFSRWLVRTGRRRRPRGFGGLGWWLQEVLPVRLRAGLYLSWADTPGRPRADLTLSVDDGDGVDRLAVAIVDAYVEKSVR
jgi:hypothetical protein